MTTYRSLMSEEELKKLIATPIKKGGARAVYTVIDDATVVIKEVHIPFVGSNMLEWFVWAAVRESEWRDSFGECIAISHTGRYLMMEPGRYLMMERLNNIDKSLEPKTPTLPSWVGDVWPNNFGINAAGQIKIRDYASVDLSEPLAGAEGFRSAWQK
jgi:hypothetical protein